MNMLLLPILVMVVCALWVAKMVIEREFDGLGIALPLFFAAGVAFVYKFLGGG